MSEQEIPLEGLQEGIMEKGGEAKEKEKERWTFHVALSTACIAVLAAIASLLSGHHENESLIDQIKASDQWSYYQAKSIKNEIVNSTGKVLEAIPGKGAAPGNLQATAARYEKEKEEIKKKAEEFEADSSKHLGIHLTLAKAVTIFQIAIAISAISILTRRKLLFYGSLILAAGGIAFLLMALIPG